MPDGKVSDFKKRVRLYVNSEPFYDIMWGVSHLWDKAKKLGFGQLPKALKSANAS
jgi:hypothetical protein